MVHDVATGLAARGHSVTVYTTDVFDSTKRLNVTEMPTIVDGCQVYYFRNLSNSLAWNQNLYLPLNLVSVTPSDIAKFDIVHLHDYRTFANAVIHGRIKKANVPYVLSAHGSILRIISKRAVKRAFDMIWGYQILRDADLLSALPHSDVGFTITTPDDRVSAALEPGAPVSSRRLAAIEALAARGVSTWVFFGPVIPHYSDESDQVRRLFRLVNDAGAGRILVDRVNLYPNCLSGLQHAFSGDDAALARLRFARARPAEYEAELRAAVQDAARDFSMEVETVF